ncbi:hypothetical protein PILCRDRAFT_830103, partial [Piloderma croceum F 1598]
MTQVPSWRLNINSRRDPLATSYVISNIPICPPFSYEPTRGRLMARECNKHPYI